MFSIQEHFHTYNDVTPCGSEAASDPVGAVVRVRGSPTAALQGALGAFTRIAS
jgi:hypothetical protein